MAVKSLLSWPGVLRTLLSQARLAARLLREPRVSTLTKAMLAAAGLYLVSPVDFVPDLLPVLGQVDDLAIVLIALQTFIHLCPASAVSHHRAAIETGQPYSPMPSASDFIDVDWRREN